MQVSGGREALAAEKVTLVCLSSVARSCPSEGSWWHSIQCPSYSLSLLLSYHWDLEFGLGRDLLVLGKGDPFPKPSR